MRVDIKTPRPLFTSAEGLEVYEGDTTYQLEGTDKVWLDEEAYIQWVMENYTIRKEASRDE